MGNLARLGVAAIVSIGLGAGLWGVLQPGFSVDPGIATAAAAGLAGVVVVLGAVWATQSVGDSPAASEAQRVPKTLERATNCFTDRTDEWAEIQAKVRLAKSRKETFAAFMIYGMPGVGKSEFAIYAANKFVTEFSQNFLRADPEMIACQVNFRGFEGLDRTDPKDELRAVLPNSADPRLSAMNLDQLSSEWRSWLHGKFLILLLNNVEDEDQVIPFLPGDSSHVVLITGRRSLPGLVGRVTLHRLNVLDMAGAVEMIRRMTNRTALSGPGDQAAIEGIAELCDYLPLAIRLAVLDLAKKPGISFARRLAELEAAPDLLLEIDEHVGKRSDGVVRSFERSYDQLPDISKRLLRLLALAPVPTVNLEAAAALADLPIREVRATLRKLDEEALISDKKLADGHEMADKGHGESYEMHDLVRLYARSLAVRDDEVGNEAAVNRLLAYYQRVLIYVDSMLTRQPSPQYIEPQYIEPPGLTVSHDFADRPTAIAWVRAELTNLLACADYVVRNANRAGRSEEKARAILFVSSIAGLLRNDGLWDRSIEFQTQAINAAEKIHVPLAAANALSERALLYRLTGQLESAVIDLDRAIEIYRQVGGPAGETGEAHALNTYGVVLDQRNNQAAGRQRLSEALDIYRRLNNPLGEANVLHDQGMTEFFAKNDDDAEQLLSQALTLYREIDHPLGMAHAYYNLARTQQRIGAERAAARNLKSARLAYRDLGNLLGEINVLVQLGAVLRHHHRRQAERVLNEATKRSTDIGNQLGLVNSLYELGQLYTSRRKWKAALATWARALEIAREHGLKREEGRLVAALASGHDRTGFVARWKR